MAAVADGAGSAPCSEAGAHMAVDAFLSTFRELSAEDPALESLSREKVDDWLRRLRADLAAIAEAESRPTSDFACTFLGAVLGPRRAMFVQVGDGAIVVRDAAADGLSWVFWPQNGEFANTTNFITQDNVEDVLQFEFADRVPVELAMFSDGIERLVLEMATRTVHSPAFRPIFDWLAKTEPPQAPTEPAPGLVAFLNSRGVNSRTDDDKTLVMATRVGMDFVV